MKRFLLILFCIAAVSGAVFYAVSVSHDRIAAAVDGVLDLRGADPADVYTLGGAWEFYWERLYEPKDFAARPPDGKTLVAVPSAWNSHGCPRTGYGTYRLTLLTPKGKEVMLYVPEILASATVWANGKRVFTAGRVGTDSASSASYAKNDLIMLPETDTGRFEIVAQVSNYNRFHGGLRNPFRAGFGTLEENPLTRSFTGWLFMLGGLVGAFFIVGFYYLTLFFFRRGKTPDSDRSNHIYLLFAAGCLLTGLRFLTDQNGPAPFFLRDSLLNTRLTEIYGLVSILNYIIVMVFSILAFELKPRRATRCVLAGMLGLPCVLSIVLPSPLRYFPAACLMFSSLPVIAMAARSLSRERIRSRPYLGLYFISLLFFLLWGPYVNITAHSYLYAGYSLNSMFLALAQFVMLSQEYAEARRRARELAAKNDFYHKMAHDLLSPLTLVSTSVQVAGMKPEKAPALLQRSQEEIMKMAEMINAALDEADAGDEEK